MLYQSTRNAGKTVKAAEAIVKGISEDGGLFVPCEIPKITLEDLNDLAGKSYRERAIGILSLYLSDFTIDELEHCVNQAYNKQNFQTDTIAPLYELSEEAYILELWHGPTCAFKDMALQILPHFMTCAMKKCQIDKEVVILVATSGDTGKAALEGFSDVEGTRILVFFPENGVSEIQKLQMLTQEGENVGVSAVFGNFDDAQTGVKKIFGDQEFNQRLSEKGFALSSANSINWGRLVPQIVYYVSAYCDLVKDGKITIGEPVNICVPTGNFGNILAAWYAKKMGLPVKKFICASNSNNVLTDFIRTGVYNKNRDFKTTISPSMDILISSNLERLLFDLTGRDASQVRIWMKELAESGQYEISGAAKTMVDEFFYGGYCSDGQTKETIRGVWEANQYLMDTHTAVGFHVYQQYVKETGDQTKTIIASTANPYKFNKAVINAVSPSYHTEGVDEFDILSKLNEVTGMGIPASLAQLKEKPVRFHTACSKEEMTKVVSDMLGILM